MTPYGIFKHFNPTASNGSTDLISLQVTLFHSTVVRDMFALNELPLRSAYLSTGESVERAKYRQYLGSRRTSADRIAGGTVELAQTTSLIAYLNVQVGGSRDSCCFCITYDCYI